MTIWLNSNKIIILYYSSTIVIIIIEIEKNELKKLNWNYKKYNLLVLIVEFMCSVLHVCDMNIRFIMLTLFLLSWW